MISDEIRYMLFWPSNEQEARIAALGTDEKTQWYTLSRKGLGEFLCIELTIMRGALRMVGRVAESPGALERYAGDARGLLAKRAYETWEATIARAEGEWKS